MKSPLGRVLASPAAEPCDTSQARAAWAKARDKVPGHQSLQTGSPFSEICLALSLWLFRENQPSALSPHGTYSNFLSQNFNLPGSQVYIHRKGLMAAVRRGNVCCLRNTLFSHGLLIYLGWLAGGSSWKEEGEGRRLAITVASSITWLTPPSRLSFRTF